MNYFNKNDFNLSNNFSRTNNKDSGVVLFADEHINFIPFIVGEIFNSEKDCENYSW